MPGASDYVGRGMLRFEISACQKNALIALLMHMYMCICMCYYLTGKGCKNYLMIRQAKLTEQEC